MLLKLIWGRNSIFFLLNIEHWSVSAWSGYAVGEAYNYNASSMVSLWSVLWSIIILKYVDKTIYWQNQKIRLCVRLWTIMRLQCVRWPALLQDSWAQAKPNLLCVCVGGGCRGYSEALKVSIEHLQQVRHANRGRLLLWTPGPVPLWDFHVISCRDQSLLHLFCFRTFEFRTSLGTSVLL